MESGLNCHKPQFIIIDYFAVLLDHWAVYFTRKVTEYISFVMNDISHLAFTLYLKKKHKAVAGFIL